MATATASLLRRIEEKLQTALLVAATDAEGEVSITFEGGEVEFLQDILEASKPLMEFWI